MACNSSVDLLIVVANRIVRVFNMSGATWVVTLDVVMVFDRFYKVRSFSEI